MLDPSQLCLSALPSVALDCRKELPIFQGIYFAIAPDSSVLYIGKAKNIFNRWVGHHRLIDLKKIDGVVLAWIEVEGDRDSLDAAEAVCIEYFRPKLNGTDVSPNSLGRKNFTVWLPRELLSRLDALAKQEYRTPSRQLEWMLLWALDEYEANVDKPDWDDD